MRTVKPRPRLWILLLGLCLVFFTGAAAAAQTCKYDSIPATAPASRFTDNGDGTVTDKTTGLQWQRCSQGQTWSGGTCAGTATGHTWQAALQLADVATYAGRSDWRLPNIKELASIVEQACYTFGLPRPMRHTPALPGSCISSMAMTGTTARATAARFGWCEADSDWLFGGPGARAVAVALLGAGTPALGAWTGPAGRSGTS